MKIISKYRDYYDSVQGVMYDSGMIFHRKEVMLPNHSFLKVFHYRYGSDNYYSLIRDGLVVIGFCDKIYLLVSLLEREISPELDKKIGKIKHHKTNSRRFYR